MALAEVSAPLLGELCAGLVADARVRVMWLIKPAGLDVVGRSRGCRMEMKEEPCPGLGHAALGGFLTSLVFKTSACTLRMWPPTPVCNKRNEASLTPTSEPRNLAEEHEMSGCPRKSGSNQRAQEITQVGSH